MAQYGGMPGAGRGSNQQPTFYPGPRGPTNQARMTSRSVVMPNNPQYSMPQPVRIPPWKMFLFFL